MKYLQRSLTHYSNKTHSKVSGATLKGKEEAIWLIHGGMFRSLKKFTFNYLLLPLVASKIKENNIYYVAIMKELYLTL